MDSVRGDRHHDRRGRALMVLAALVVVGLVTIEGSRAAFSATTSNSGNRLAAGTITVSDDTGGSVLYDIPGMAPAQPAARCVNVVYTGTMATDVRFFLAVTGGFAPYLTTTVEVGTGAAGGTGFSCAGFAPSATIGRGTLADLAAAHSSYATGLGGFTGATSGSTRSYRITITMVDDNAAQGQTSTATFGWEARPA